MAVITPSGMETAAETSVTARDATIKGKMPKSGGLEVGYHNFPNTKSEMVIFLNIGRPSMNRKAMIMKIIAMEASAAQKKKVRTALSVL